MDCSTRTGSTAKVTRRTGEKIESTGITPMVDDRLLLVGRHVAPAPLDGDVEGQAALGVEGGDVQVGVEDLDVGRGLQVGGRGVAGAPLVEAQGDRLVGVHPDQEVLQVQDDVGDVLFHPGQGRELVQGLVEAHLGHRRARDRGEQGPAQRVAERVPEAGVERADGEALAVVLLFVDGLDGRSLDDEHLCWLLWSSVVVGRRVGAPEVGPWGRSGYFEYSSTMSCSCTGSSMCSRSGGFRTSTAKPPSPVSSHAGSLAVERVHVAPDGEHLVRELCLSVTVSPLRTR